MKPIKRILIAVILAGLFCQLFFLVFSKEINKYQVHNTERLTELLLQHTYYDMIFVGSSRTHYSVNPQIIDSICSLKSYNAGLDGGNLYEFEMILKAYLANHPSPKYLVLTIDLHSFSQASKMFNYPVYFPYTSNKIINTYLTENHHLNIYKKVFPFLKIIDFDDNTKDHFVEGIFGKTELGSDGFQFKGYLSNTSNCIDVKAVVSPQQNLIITNDRKQCLERIISLCHQLNIKLIFTYAPEYNREDQQIVKNSNEIFSLIDSFAKKNNIQFLRDDHLAICSNHLLFVDILHLNKEGARQYSIILAKELLGIINLKKN